MIRRAPPNNQLHTNPAIAPLFNPKRRGRRVGELKRWTAKPS